MFPNLYLTDYVSLVSWKFVESVFWLISDSWVRNTSSKSDGLFISYCSTLECFLSTAIMVISINNMTGPVSCCIAGSWYVICDYILSCYSSDDVREFQAGTASFYGCEVCRIGTISALCRYVIHAVWPMQRRIWPSTETNYRPPPRCHTSTQL